MTLVTQLVQLGSVCLLLELVVKPWNWWMMCTHLAQEMDPGCQSVLKDNLRWCGQVTGQCPRESCLFGDITELIPNGTIQTGWPYSQKLSAVNGCDLSVVQQCEAHGQATCKVYKGCSSFDCSGLPCPDFSTAGLKRKRQGPTVPVYMAHGKYVCKSRVPLLLIECTKDHWHSYLTYFVFSTNRFG